MRAYGYWVSDGPVLTEGMPWPNGEAPLGPGQMVWQGARPPDEPASPGLVRLLQLDAWQGAPVTLVVPTADVSFRNLKFPFRDSRRIREALRYELEAELLEPVDLYALDLDAQPTEDGGAEARVYLLPAQRLRGLLEGCQTRNLTPVRITFAADALLAVHPPATALQFQVYVGAEEAFLSLVRGGRLEAVQTLSSTLGTILAELLQQGVADPAEVLKVLAGDEDRSKINRSLLRTHLIHELQAVADQINLALRVHGMGQKFAVSFHGLYGHCFAMHGAECVLDPDAAPPPPRPGAPRALLGILGDLQHAPATLNRGHGINFHRVGQDWMALARDSRRPLLALAILTGLLVLVWGGDMALGLVQLNRELSAAQSRVAVELARHVDARVPPSARLPVLEERVAKLAEQDQSAAAFRTYRYNTLELLRDLSQQTAGEGDLRVDSLQVSGPHLVMAGSSANFQAPEALKDKLAKLPRFAGKVLKVQLQRTGQALTFRLTAD